MTLEKQAYVPSCQYLSPGTTTSVASIRNKTSDATARERDKGSFRRPGHDRHRRRPQTWHALSPRPRGQTEPTRPAGVTRRAAPPPQANRVSHSGRMACMHACGRLGRKGEKRRRADTRARSLCPCRAVHRCLAGFRCLLLRCCRWTWPDGLGEIYLLKLYWSRVRTYVR